MDIISDFYKRFEKNGISVYTLSCPASVTLLGNNNDFRTPVLALSLSFGTSVAYRCRKDNRIVLERTDTDTPYSANIINTHHIPSPDWAKNMLHSINKLIPEPQGIDMLFHNDTGNPEFSDITLCGVFAYASLFGTEKSIRSIIKATNSTPTQIASLLTGNRFSVVNTATLEYIPYNFNFKGYKIVLIKINKSHYTKISQSFSLNEKDRLNNAVFAIINNDISSLGECIYSSGTEILNNNKNNNCNYIFSYASEFSKMIRPFNDLSGVIVIVKEKLCDEMVKVIGSRYEKKTGGKPAFYISD